MARISGSMGLPATARDHASFDTSGGESCQASATGGEKRHHGQACRRKGRGKGGGTGRVLHLEGVTSPTCRHSVVLQETIVDDASYLLFRTILMPSGP